MRAIPTKDWDLLLLRSKVLLCGVGWNAGRYNKVEILSPMAVLLDIVISAIHPSVNCFVMAVYDSK